MQADMTFRGSHAIPRRLLHLRGNACEFFEVGLIERAIVGADEIVPGFGQEHATSGKLAGKVRNQQQRYVKGSCNLGGMERTRASESDHHEIARIVAAL